MPDPGVVRGSADRAALAAIGDALRKALGPWWREVPGAQAVEVAANAAWAAQNHPEAAAAAKAAGAKVKSPSTTVRNVLHVADGKDTKEFGNVSDLKDMWSRAAPKETSSSTQTSSASARRGTTSSTSTGADDAMLATARRLGGGTAAPSTSTSKTSTSSSSSGSGGGSTSSFSSGGSSSSTSGGTATGGGGGPADRLPGGFEVWDVNGVNHLVYTMPGSDTPMAWRVDGDLSNVVGDVNPDRSLSSKGAAALGMLVLGRHRDLVDRGDDPFGAFMDDVKDRTKTEPWLADRQVMVQAAEAFLEGRAISIADLRDTDWYNSRSDKEREWVVRAAQSSPEEIARTREDSRALMRQTLLQAGVSNPPAQLVNFMAEKHLTGAWSDVKTAQQVTAIADPFSGIEVDTELGEAAEGLNLVTAADDIRDMRERVQDWLGPFGSAYTDRQLKEWAGMLRNDANGEAKFEDLMKGQRIALLPEYDNPDVKWSDVAAPWKAYIARAWGEEVDDDDPVLLSVVRANDANKAGEIARRVGVQRGVGGAVNEVTDALTGAFGGNVRRSL